MRKPLCLTACCAVVAALLAGCARCSGDESRAPRRATREQFIRYNRYLVRSDSVCIAQYSDTMGLNTRPTATNLWLTVRDSGSGRAIVNGDKVSFDYTVTTLLGDTLYASSRDGVATVTVGQGDVNMGVDEVLTVLREGGEATAILIPEKAFGVRGDGDAVRGRMILRYDIKVLAP